MNTESNTPPNGDFARYVERLSAQALLPKAPPQAGDHGLDIGMTPSPSPHDAATDAAAAMRRRSMQSNAEPGGNATRGLGEIILRWLAKNIK